MHLDENLPARYSQVFVSSGVGETAAAVYADRRSQLLQKMDSFGVFAGVPREPGSEESFTSTWSRFVQDPAFLFLTGVNQPGCYLLLDPLAKDPLRREILFVPPKDASKEFWYGLRIGYSENLDEIRLLTGIKTILPVERFWPLLRELSTSYRGSLQHAYAFCLEFTTQTGDVKRFRGDHNDAFAEKVNAVFSEQGLEFRSLAPLHFDLRVVLDSGRIAAVKKAQEWTRLAFEETLREIPMLHNERQLGLNLDYRMQSLSDGDLAFPTIVAGGRNACCLHYAKKDEPLRKGELVLLDFGIRSGTQHSDISRTVPVSGQFDPLQRLLYQIVLDAQEFHQAQVKPGALLKELDLKVWEFIEDALESRFVSLGGHYQLEYELRPHGVSHLIGEQVHEGDPFRCYSEKPLVPGMMISNEPGVYGHFEAFLEGIHYDQWIGIRIEDDLLITENGCENLSQGILKSIEALESAMRRASSLE